MGPDPSPHADNNKGLMRSDGEFYLRWVSANAWSESVGLGTTMVVVWLAKPWIDSVTGSPAVLVTLLVAVSAGGLIEGAVVGFAQQGVLRVRLPTLRPRAWLLATALGAGLAWLLGSVAEHHHSADD